MNMNISLKNFLFCMFPLLLSSINKHKHTAICDYSLNQGLLAFMVISSINTCSEFFFPTSSSFHYNLTGKKCHTVTIPNPSGC